MSFSVSSAPSFRRKYFKQLAHIFSLSNGDLSFPQITQAIFETSEEYVSSSSSNFIKLMEIFGLKMP